MTLDQLHELNIRNCKSQRERVLYWFNHVSPTITPLESWKQLGIYRLADVILQLRKRGYEIITNDVKRANRFGEDVDFAEYELKKV